MFKSKFNHQSKYFGGDGMLARYPKTKKNISIHKIIIPDGKNCMYILLIPHQR
jgi:hypothetical protein